MFLNVKAVSSFQTLGVLGLFLVVLGVSEEICLVGESVSTDFIGAFFLFLTLLLYVSYHQMAVHVGFSGLLCTAALGGIICLFFTSSSPLTFFVLFEVSLIPMFALILGSGNSPERVVSTFYFLLYTCIGSFPLFFNIVAQEWYFGGKDFLVFSRLDSDHIKGGGGFSFCLLFWVLAFLVKSPMYGVHLWLPKAHVEAPTMGSMILAAVLLKMGTFGLLRFHWAFGEYSLSIFSWVSFSLLISGAMAFRSPDVKVFIAYSSIAHMGVVILGLWGLDSFALAGVLFISLSHGFSSSGLFKFVDGYYRLVGSRNLVSPPALLQISSWLSLLVFLLCASNASVPPSLAIFGEVGVFSGIISFSWVGGFIFAGYVFIVGLYNIYLYLVVCHGFGLQSSENLGVPVGYLSPLLVFPVTWSLLIFSLLIGWLV